MVDAYFIYEGVEDTIICDGQTIYLINASINADSTFWEVEIGGYTNTVSQDTIQITLQDDGTGSYTFYLIAKDINECVDTFQRTFHILPYPELSYNYTLNGSGVDFTLMSNLGLEEEVHWTWGDDTETITNDSTPSHTYVNDGVYEVCISYTNRCGMGQCCDIVVVDNVQNASCLGDSLEVFFTTSSKLVCEGTSIDFTNLSSSGALTYEWYINNSLVSSNMNYNHIFSQAGKHIVSLVVKYPNACEMSYTTLVEVVSNNVNLDVIYTKNGPIVNFVFDSIDAHTKYGIMVLEDTSSLLPISLFGNNITYTFPEAGTYTVLVGASNFICGENWLVDTLIVTVEPLPITYQKLLRIDGKPCGISSCIQTSDQKIVIIGKVLYAEQNSEEAIVAKLNIQGEMIWSKRFSSTQRNRPGNLVEGANGGFMAYINNIDSTASNGNFYVIKWDDDGNEEWHTTLGNSTFGFAQSIKATSDGGCILTGYTSSFGVSEKSAFLIKLNANGSLSWGKYYNTGDTSSLSAITAKDVLVDSDGGYTVLGHTWQNQQSLFLMKTDAFGNVNWVKSYGGNNLNYDYVPILSPKIYTKMQEPFKDCTFKIKQSLMKYLQAKRSRINAFKTNLQNLNPQSLRL